MRSRRKRFVTGVAAMIVATTLATLAIAQDGVPPGSKSAGSSSQAEPGSRARPELIAFEDQERYRPGVPRGPAIDFCPTPEQTEQHLKLYGFDYKPRPRDGLACSSEGAWTPPGPPYPPDPDESLSEREICEQEKREFLEARPLPSEDPLTLLGEKPNGGTTGIILDADPKWVERERIEDIHDWARGMGC